MTQDKVPDRDYLKQVIWRLTEWRGSADTVDQLMDAIDAYADARVSATNAIVERLADEAERGYDPEQLRHHETTITSEPNWKQFGHELVTLLYAGARDTAFSAERQRRVAELSGFFGNSLAESYWMREAALLGDELAKAWLEDLGDGMAYTDLHDITQEQQCRVCKQWKPFIAYPRDASYKSGYRTRCKTCTNKQRVERDAASRPPKPPTQSWVSDSSEDVALGLSKQCAGCGQRLSLDNFHRDAQQRDGRTKRCKRCRRGTVSDNEW